MNRLGATPRADGSTRFEVWAPYAAAVELEVGVDGRPRIEMAVTEERDVWTTTVEGVGHGVRYRYRLDGDFALADPASGWQPDGVHGPSAVVDPARFTWTDDGWRGVELADTVLYELHVGTFTPEGTFDGMIGQLDRLLALGVTSIELMPVNAFPGRRNWGYDGVFPSAVQESYGGPDGLARLVDAAHERGLGVVLDVVYNHLGPEGSVHARYGPYFTDAFATPWGDALNVAQAHSDEVRRMCIESATRWIEDFHLDALRLDAVDTIHDPSARPFLAELIAAVHAAGDRAGRTVLTFVESAANDPRTVRPAADDGMGADAQWNDDVHHALRVALTGERRGYYLDYDGVGDLAHAFAHRWVFDGRWSEFRARTHGRSVDDVAHQRFVAFSANHDHVGNTPTGARPPFDHARRLVAAATVLLSPYTPMLFMGDEYAEPAPFPFFVDHGEGNLLQAVRQGRRKEYARSEWPEEVADPASPATFERAVLDPSQAARSPHREILAAHVELLACRRVHSTLTEPGADHDVERIADAVVIRRHLDGASTVLVVNLGSQDVTIPVGPSTTIAFDTADRRWWPAEAKPPTAARVGDGAAIVAGLTVALFIS